MAKMTNQMRIPLDEQRSEVLGAERELKSRERLVFSCH